MTVFTGNNSLFITQWPTADYCGYGSWQDRLGMLAESRSRGITTDGSE